MIYRVDFSKKMWRNLYPIIFERLLEFGFEHDMSEQDITARMIRLQANDKSVVLLVELDNTGIISHCLIQIMQNETVAFIEQALTKARKDNTFIQECEEYITNVLRDEYITNGIYTLSKIVISCSENKERAYNKKYGFNTKCILMEKDIKPPSVEVN